MKFQEWFEKWGLKNIKLNLKFAEFEFQPSPDDEEAAWEMYVELLTRVTTQQLRDCTGDESTALHSIYKLFDITRDILKIHGRKSPNFTKIAIIVLNQIIRPFTSKWHKLFLQKAFEDEDQCIAFRRELVFLQDELCNYARMLAEMARVEDLTNLSLTG